MLHCRNDNNHTSYLFNYYLGILTDLKINQSLTSGTLECSLCLLTIDNSMNGLGALSCTMERGGGTAESMQGKTHASNWNERRKGFEINQGTIREFNIN